MCNIPPSIFLKGEGLRENSYRKGKTCCRKENVGWENLDWFKRKNMVRKLIEKKGLIGKFGSSPILGA